MINAIFFFMKLTFLGTGTSHGVPVIGCDCSVCKSTDLHNKRYRSSVYIQTNDDKYILIDIGPEFRLQAIENNIKKIDSVLLTHSHADHLHGIDDLRIFSCSMHKVPEDKRSLAQYYAPPLPVYTNQKSSDDILNRFGYFFTPVKEGGGHAKVELNVVNKSFYIGTTQITPIPMMHGHLETTGWLLTEKLANGTKNSIAYLTDCNYISDESISLIKANCGNLKHLVIDGLRIKPHSTHFSYLEAMKASNKIGAEKVWFTHLTHNESHNQTTDYIKEHLHEFPELQKCVSVLPAYDKLIIES